MAKFPGFSPRRSAAAPTFCALLLITVWLFHLPHPTFTWLDPPVSAGTEEEQPINNKLPLSPTGTVSSSTPKSGPGSSQSQSHPAAADIDLADPEAPFIGWPLERLCTEAKRVEGLVFVCDNNSGGIGNIRNYIQTCLRYALEAGATGITLPKIRQRDSEDLANIWTDYLPFTYMFDEGHFRAAFGRYCPHVRIYDNATAIPGVGPDEQEIEYITPKEDFGDREECHPWDSNRHFQRFGDRLRAWLQVGSSRPPPSAHHVRAVRFNWGVLWDWQVWYDGPEFATTFGHVLRFNDQLLRLGNKVLANMRELAAAQAEKRKQTQQEQGQQQNQQQEQQQQQQQQEGEETMSGGHITRTTTTTTKSAADAAGAGAEAGAFIGVHLRTESDAREDWPTYEEQFEAFKRQAILQGSSGSGDHQDYRQRFGAAYLATGDGAEAAKFVREAAAELSDLKVVGKEDLLAGEDLAELRSLTFDQQGIVDAVVLLGADFFVGTMPSSFSVYVAMRRHLRTGGLYTRPWKVGAAEGDGLSHMGGHYEKYWENWLFMWDGMWP